jgi:uroporphyrinogen decarboxylase
MLFPSRERIRKVLAHQEPDRVPYCPVGGREITALVDSMGLSADHRAFCLTGDVQWAQFAPEVERKVFAPYLPADLPPAAAISYWGVAKIAAKTEAGHHAGHKTYHPLENVNSVVELERYPFPYFAKRDVHAPLAAKVAAWKAQGFTVLGQMSQTILETAYEMRGIEKLMLDFSLQPEYVECLFERIASERRFQARKLAEAGVDILRIGDDIATQQGLLVSPKLYRERIKPLHASVIAVARAVAPQIPVKYHSDGKLTPLLDDLIEIGVSIINPVQPECMDLREIKRRYGKTLTLWGCMPVQSVFAHGSRQEVIAYLQFLMDEIAPGGGLALKFTNMILTEQVLENVRTFFEVFFEMGRYNAR